jgi:hypothetical protein
MNGNHLEVIAVMDYATSQKLQQELSSGESLLWVGRPAQGIKFRGSDVFLIPFGLFWFGFSFQAFRSTLTPRTPPFFLVFMSFFLAMGFYLLIGRFILDSINRRRTYYGVTDDRILILTEFPTRRIKSLNLRTLTDITFSAKRSGIGSITFGAQNPMAAWHGGAAWPGMGQYQSPHFDLIQDVRSVYEIIRDAQKKSS